MPAIILVGFIPMLLVAFGYRELNRAMPDSGTSFTWATRAFGPWVGWLAGWGLIAATILVLSNLAGIAVDFLFLLIAQIAGNPEIADLAFNPFINVGVCLLFMLGATLVSYRDMQTTQKLQYCARRLPGARAGRLLGRRVRRRSRNGNAFDATPIELSLVQPVRGRVVLGAFVAGPVALDLHLLGLGRHPHDERGDEGPREDARAARRPSRSSSIVVLYLLIAVVAARLRGRRHGRATASATRTSRPTSSSTSPARSSARSRCSSRSRCSRARRRRLQSTFVSPARTLLAMGHYGALPEKFAQVSPRFFTPGYATIVSAIVASVFYAVMRFVSEDVLWDTITTLGMMICFYYGITAFACVWYFRKQWFDSARNVFFTFLFPLIGGVILAVLFFTTLIDCMDPAYGSGSNIGGARPRLHPRHGGHRSRVSSIMIWQAPSARPSSAARRSRARSQRTEPEVQYRRGRPLRHQGAASFCVSGESARDLCRIARCRTYLL